MKTKKPVRQSVGHRWFLPPRTAFLAVPLPVLEVLTHRDDLGAAELRALLWLLADWYWPGGVSREVNVQTLAKRSRMAGPNAHRALGALGRKGLLEITHRGRGRLPVVSIAPLVRAGQDTDRGVSRRYTPKGDVDKVYHRDTPEYHGDTPGCITPEPGVRTKSLLQQDQAKAVRLKEPDEPELRRAEILATLEQLAQAEASAPPVAPKEG